MNQKLFTPLLGAFIFLSVVWVFAAAPDFPTRPEADLRWWREARFGMFVHWGPVSLRGTELGWSRGADVPAAEYDELYRSFNPTNFDANAWARLAKNAGMKYLVLTSKHHDGFCLWDTKFTDYNIMNTPFGRDVVKELARACRKEGIVFFVNSRVSKARRGMEGSSQAGEFPGGFDTPEQRVGNFQTNRAWESCITIGRQWAWKPDDKLKSSDDCIQTLVRTAGGGGNLLLNVGPMPSGEIEARQADRLREIGAWLKKNGESIYGTGGGPFAPGEWGATTHKKNTVFVHVLNWRGTNTVTLPPFDRAARKSKLFGGGKLELKATDEATIIRVEPKHQRTPDTVIVLTLADKPRRD